MAEKIKVGARVRIKERTAPFYLEGKTAKVVERRDGGRWIIEIEDEEFTEKYGPIAYHERELEVIA